ncbi:hypothetical protein GOBAR_DD08219 [Gossypium barbadense]|nr:hypothetical protein GOBAR_DD08219 [Gossypium barbadense]
MHDNKLRKQATEEAMVVEDLAEIVGGQGYLARVCASPHAQVIHIRVCSKKRDNIFMCSAVYASPQAKVLDLIVESFNKPWLIASDFNSILDSSNRKEGVARLVPIWL